MKDTQLKKTVETDEGLSFYCIDDIYLISIPKTWKTIKSDRFRAVSENKNTRFSVTSYQGKQPENSPMPFDELKEWALKMFDNFITEGGYQGIDDLDIGDSYIYRAFSVDNETQYYYYTSRLILNYNVIIALILRVDGDYDETESNMIKKIGKSISPKVSSL